MLPSYRVERCSLLSLANHLLLALSVTSLRRTIMSLLE